MVGILAVGTRKGLFLLHQNASGGWDIGEPAFLGVPVSMVAKRPGTQDLFAALDHGHFGVKFHASTDGGATWIERTAPGFPADASSDKESGKAPSVSLLWSLETASRDGVLWAGTIPGGLFRSDDDGESWSLIRGLWDLPERADWFGGGFDDPGIHSICVDPRDSDRVVIAASSGGVWLSEDGGETWSPSGKGLWAAYVPPERREDPAYQDPHRVVQCPSAPDTYWMQHHNGIFHTEDNAQSWRQIEPVPVSDFGFAVAVHPADPDTAWFVPAIADEKRVPTDGALCVLKTEDAGRSFVEQRQGLPQANAYDLVYRHGLDVSADGSTLAMASTTGNLWISTDGGEGWSSAAAHLPPVYCVRFLPD